MGQGVGGRWRALAAVGGALALSKLYSPTCGESEREDTIADVRTGQRHARVTSYCAWCVLSNLFADE